MGNGLHEISKPEIYLVGTPNHPRGRRWSSTVVLLIWPAKEIYSTQDTISLHICHRETTPNLSEMLSVSLPKDSN
jgi:hypothetical protein